jgi:zinc transport system permease protein
MEPASATPGPTWAAFVAAWDLFRDPIYCAVAAGAVLGFLGVYVVLRRMVFVSAAVTQASALGVALAFFLEIHLDVHVEPVLGASLLALLATLLLMLDHRALRLPRESLLGLAYALTGGATVLIENRIAQEAHDIHAILFGSAVLVRPADLIVVAATGGALLLLHLWWFRGLTFASFDPEAARVQGLPVRFLGGFVLVSVGVMVGVSARALGALPVFAFCALPATTVLATLLGALSGVLGYVAAFFGELPVGGSQTMVAGAFLLAALALRFLRRRLS